MEKEIISGKERKEFWKKQISKDSFAFGIINENGKEKIVSKKYIEKFILNGKSKTKKRIQK